MPDANTVCDFHEALIRAGALDALFTRIDGAIRAAGYLATDGQILDPTLVAAPRPRNTGGEKAAIRWSGCRGIVEFALFREDLKRSERRKGGPASSDRGGDDVQGAGAADAVAPAPHSPQSNK